MGFEGCGSVWSRGAAVVVAVVVAVVLTLGSVVLLDSFAANNPGSAVTAVLVGVPSSVSRGSTVSAVSVYSPVGLFDSSLDGRGVLDCDVVREVLSSDDTAGWLQLEDRFGSSRLYELAGGCLSSSH